jgi:hypothetical protein
LKACRPSAILTRLACPLCSAEHRVHLSLSGLWSYTTRWDTIMGQGQSPPCVALLTPRSPVGRWPGMLRSVCVARAGQRAFAACPITENGLPRIVGHPKPPWP